MRVNKIRGTGDMAWDDFTLIDITGEYAPYSGRWEFSICVLGLRVTVQYVFDQSFNDRMKERIEELRAERKDEQVGTPPAE